MDGYKQWVLKNRELVVSLESLANWVTWIIPERFGNSELAPEVAYAVLGIVSCVNHHILLEKPRRSCVPWALVVSILRDAEAVVEVAAQRFVGDDRKWGFLALTEAAKACVRFAAFRESGYSRMLLQGGEVENEAEDTICQVNGEADKKTLEVEKPLCWATVWSWKRAAGRAFMLGEALHIFRPLAYVFLMTKFGSRSWTPWLVSLAMEVTSLRIHSAHSAGKVVLPSAERDELTRRKMMMWVLHAVRDPFFANYTRRHLENAHRALKSVPLFGVGKLVEISEGVQSRYTYTSGS